MDELKYRNRFNNFIVIFIITTILFQYPLNLNLFSKVLFNLSVLFVFIYALYLSLKVKRIGIDNLLSLKEIKIFIIFWFLYYFILFFGTLISEKISIYYLFSYLSKILVFMFLLHSLTKDLIYKILKIYSNLAVFIAVISIITGVFVAADLIESYRFFNEILPDKLKVYGLVFYAQSSPLNFFDFPLYRLQGLSQEAGIFAIFLFLPVVYFLFIDKSFIKFSILFFAIIWTYSFPPFLIYSLLLIILITKKYNFKIILILFLSLSLFLVTIISMDIRENERVEQKFLEGKSTNTKTFVSLRAVSLADRTNALRNYMDYIDIQETYKLLFGLGAANSTYIYGKTVANGFLFRFIDSGLIGFVFYLLSAIVLIYFSFKSILFTDIKSPDNELIIVLSISVIFLIFVSFFRQPFDSSYFQMFIYASLFKIVSLRKVRFYE